MWATFKSHRACRLAGSSVQDAVQDLDSLRRAFSLLVNTLAPDGEQTRVGGVALMAVLLLGHPKIGHGLQDQDFRAVSRPRQGRARHAVLFELVDRPERLLDASGVEELRRVHLPQAEPLHHRSRPGQPFAEELRATVVDEQGGLLGIDQGRPFLQERRHLQGAGVHPACLVRPRDSSDQRARRQQSAREKRCTAALGHARVSDSLLDGKDGGAGLGVPAVAERHP